MSDYEDSTGTYTKVSSPFTDLPDIGSPGVDGPPVNVKDPDAEEVAEEDDDEDPKEDPADYPADGGDDG
ncbi:hypothetical protein Tco_0447442, partial [Tanacetum coccineum]